MAFNVTIQYVCQRTGLEPLIIEGHTSEVDSIKSNGTLTFLETKEGIDNDIRIPDTYGPATSQGLSMVYYRGTYYKTASDIYLSEIEDYSSDKGFKYTGDEGDLTINVYYGVESDINFGPSEDELPPVTPPEPTSWNLIVNVKQDNNITKNLDVTHYGSVGVSTSTMKVTYYTDISNSSQEVHTIDLPAGYKISSVIVNNNSISSEQTFSNQNVTVQYNLVKDEYTVILDNQDATTAGTESVTATFGLEMQSIASNLPKKTGYTFGGYYTGTNGSGTQYYKADGSSAKNWGIPSNTTLYAKWTANTYTVKFNANGGTGTMSNQNFTYDEEQNLTTNAFKREGYTFAGWNTKADGTGTSYTDNQEVNNLSTNNNEIVNLYAKWTANTYTVKFNANGGTGTMNNQNFTYGITQNLKANAFTRTGYTFVGWATSENGNKVYNDEQSVSNLSSNNGAIVNLYAKWEGNACTITVVGNPSDLTGRLSGGGNYKNGDSVTITAQPKYDVYKFENWTKNGSVISTSETYTFTANGNETYVANFIDNRKSALFKIHVLDDSYNETGLCEVEIKYGELDNPSQNSIKRAANRTIEIDGPTTSANSVTKTHVSGTDFLDSINGNLTSQVFYEFPESINNEPFINILYNGNTVEEEDLYTDNSLTFDVYYGKLPKPGTGDGTDTDYEITVKFKYYLDGTEIDTSNAASWPTSNIDELKCYWFKYDDYTKNDKELAITGITDRIKFSYVDTYWDDPAKSDPSSNLKNPLEIEAPMYTGLADTTFLTGVDINNPNKTYTYVDCPNNQLDIDVYFTSYEFNAYVYSNLPEYGDAYIAQKGTKHIVFHASSVAPTAIRFDAEVLNNAFYFNRWVNYNTKSELSTENPWIIYHPDGQDYHVEAEFLGRQINIKLDPNNDKAEAFWQRVGIVAGTNKFKKISFDADEPIKSPDAKTGYEFLGWYTSETNNNGSGDLIIDKNGNLQANVSGWTSSDGLWIKGPDEVSPGLIADVVIYAKWKPVEYTITLNPNGGSGGQQTVKVDYLSSSLKSTITNPTRTGYTFDGWYTTASGGSLVIGTDKKLKPDVSDYTNDSSQWIKASGATLYAHWTVNKHTLTWDLNGGTVTTAGTCAPLDSTGTVSGEVEYLSNITAPIVSKTGYTFEGWSAENGNGIITPVSKMPDGDVKYVAVYSINTYTITVNDDPKLDKVYIYKNGENKGVTTTCETGDTITLVAENTIKYVLSSWKKGGKDIFYTNEVTFTAPGTYLDANIENNIFTAYYREDPSATLKINFIVDDIVEKTAIFKFDTTFHFLGDSTEGYRCEIQGEPECIEGDIEITQEGYFFIPSKYNEKDICMVPHEQGSGTTELICSNKGTTTGYDGSGSQYYLDNTAKNQYCPTEYPWQAYLPTNTAGETHLVFPAAEKEEYGVLYGPLVIDVYYGEIPERFLPVIPEDVEITTVSGLTLLQRIQNKIATFKWLNNLFGEPEKTTWESYDNSGLKSLLKDDSKETPLSMHCIEYGDLQIYNQGSGNENINLDKTIKQYSFTSDATIIKPLNGQVVLEVSKIEGNKIYFNITNLSSFENTDNGIYIYFSVNSETNENNATLYKMKLPKSPSTKGLLLTILDVSNIESLYIYRAPIMVDSTKTGIIPKIHFSSEKEELPISVYDKTTLNIVI